MTGRPAQEEVEQQIAWTQAAGVCPKPPWLGVGDTLAPEIWEISANILADPTENSQTTEDICIEPWVELKGTEGSQVPTVQSISNYKKESWSKRGMQGTGCPSPVLTCACFPQSLNVHILMFVSDF